MYYIVFILLGVLAIREYQTKIVDKKLFSIMYFLLTMMVVLRYGQGSDYFNYENLYKEIGYYGDTSFFLLFLKSDWGFSLLSYAFYAVDCPYPLFASVIALITMLLFRSFFKRQCGSSMISLSFFYCTIFLIYPYSIIRQGLAMGIFACYMYPLLFSNRWKRYVVYGLGASTLHLSALILLLLPLMYKVRISQKMDVGVMLLLAVMLLANIHPFSFISFSRMDAYLGEASSNMIFAKFARICIVFPLLFRPKRWDCDLQFSTARKMMYMGFFMYCMTAFSELTASRLWGYFLLFECVIFYKISLKINHFRFKFNALLYYLLISSVLWLKDINGFMAQGNYEHCTILSYPYISIFDGDDTVSYYRKNISMAGDRRE